MAPNKRHELADEAQELWPLFERLRDATRLEAGRPLGRLHRIRFWRSAASLAVAAALVAAALLFWFPRSDRMLLAEVAQTVGPVGHVAAQADLRCCASGSVPMHAGCRLTDGMLITCGPEADGTVRLRSGCVLELAPGSTVRFGLSAEGMPTWTLQSGALHYECGVTECRIQVEGTELRARKHASLRVTPAAAGVDLQVLGGPVCVRRSTEVGETWETCAPGVTCCMPPTPPRETRPWIPKK